MGTGFYGISLDVSARIMLKEIKEHLSSETSVEEVVICVLDNREFRVFQENWDTNN